MTSGNVKAGTEFALITLKEVINLLVNIDVILLRYDSLFTIKSVLKAVLLL